jgi:hypothetical protein
MADLLSCSGERRDSIHLGFTANNSELSRTVPANTCGPDELVAAIFFQFVSAC